MVEQTVQNAVDSFSDNLTWKVVLRFLWVLSMRPATSILTLYPNLAGFLPYKQWSCVENNTVCLTRVKLRGVSRDSFCGVKGEAPLKAGLDMVWELNGRKTYAVDWDLLCGREYLGTLISSSLFVGALIALMTYSMLFDKFGRLRVCQITQIVLIISSIIMIFPYNLWHLMITRCIVGGAVFATISGYYVLVAELVPKKWREVAMAIMLAPFTLGTFIMVLVGYLCNDWRFIIVVAVILLCSNLYPVFYLVPESPLFYLSNKRNKVSAKESLKKLGEFYGVDRDFENVDIVEVSSCAELIINASFSEFFEDLKKHPALRKHVAVMLFVWLKCGWNYYGFTFSWGTLGRDLYWSYFLSACGGIVVQLTNLIYLKILPRRTLAYFDIFAAITFLVAMAPESIGFTAISLSQIASLLGIVGSGTVFLGLFLWTQELSLTTHRGRIICISPSSARIGSFLGPQPILLFSWNKYFTFTLFSSLLYCQRF